MSIEQNWKKLNEQSDDDLSSLLQPGQIKKLHSVNPLSKIKQLLLFSLVYTVLISGLYIWIMFAFPYWPIIICLLVVLAFNGWVSYTAWQQYKSLQPQVKTEQPLLQEMERHYSSIHQWMDVQMKTAKFVYPVAATGGFMLGGMLGSEKPIGVFMGKPIILIALVIVLIIIIPVCIWFAKWMFNKSFGKHLKVLKKNIDELKAG